MGRMGPNGANGDVDSSNGAWWNGAMRTVFMSPWIKYIFSWALSACSRLNVRVSCISEAIGVLRTPKDFIRRSVYGDFYIPFNLYNML